uniref:Uncharacterized protein n=1 Tax=Sphaerodactylus townsendi TaxID=933632 RepID=A0ACB8FZ16_9SAUR
MRKAVLSGPGVVRGVSTRTRWRTGGLVSSFLLVWLFSPHSRKKNFTDLLLLNETDLEEQFAARPRTLEATNKTSNCVVLKTRSFWDCSQVP